MSVKLQDVWKEVEDLLADGFSLIPVRDKEEINKYGEPLAPKTPFGSWKEFQHRIITKQELWETMENRNTNAVAIVCGKVSGNLEIIDVDVKYKPGIDITILNDLRSFYPQLYSRLRIHQSPSKGLHILYRVACGNQHVIPGNLKLAGRLASDDEIELQLKRGVKRPNKEVNFLETRGEGGYFLAPPSLGYCVLQDNPVPYITWEERCSIITLCQSYSEIIKVAPAPTTTKSQSDWYSTNPFEDFNAKCDPIQFLEAFNWKYSHKNNKFIWFTRPDKTKGVSASWNVEKGVYFVFTSSTELEANRGYNPSTILSELMFDGDKSKTYKYLTEQGFGTVKQSVEAAYIKKAARAGKPNLPNNFSAEAKSKLTTELDRLKQDYPYGNFIKVDIETEKTSVSYEQIIYVAEHLGLYSLNGNVVLVNGHTVEKIDDRVFQDILKSYIHEEDPETYEQYCNVFEKFMKDNTKYLSTRLTLLPENRIISDERLICYKFYQNGYLTITPTVIEFNEYETFDKLVWKDKIQPRNYIDGEGGRFVEYLNLALVDPNRAKSILGFLSHDFKDETTGYIIVLTEACQNPKDGGGSGKNVFCNLLSLTTTYTSTPGSQQKLDEKFFQSWNFQKVFGINDLPKNFDFAFLKEAISGTIKLKKLFKDEKNIPVEQAPKIVCQTNFSYVISDGGLKRRIIPLEFTDFFTKCGGIDVHFGIHFPKGWEEGDFAGYDNYIAECIQAWMNSGLKLSAGELTYEGWLKQWALTFGNITDFITQNWKKWTADEYIKNEEFKKSLDEYYAENNISKNYQPTSHKVNDAIESFANKHGFIYKKNFNKKINSIQNKCRAFFKGDVPEEDLEDEIMPF